MIKKRYYLTIILLLLIGTLIFNSCGQKSSLEEEAYIKRIEDSRAQKDSILHSDPNSPFNFKGKVDFHPLNYFEVNPNFVLTSKFFENESKDTIKVFGTKGEERTAIRFGFLKLKYNEQKFQLNIYESIYKDTLKYYSIWFTDETTNNETYGVGRYINFELNENPNHIYSIDFNKAYNPYCAYTSAYSCAIPTKEDHINIAITAGEKKFHD
ncbi:MAG: DUF1684 domain-containing protein [Bacteroidota bacterium]